MRQISLSDVRPFVNEMMGLGPAIAALTDGRRKPRIPAPTIFESVLYGTVLGIESLLAIDQFLKHSDLGQVLGLERAPLVSDSTMIRSLGTMDPQVVRGLLRRAAHAALRLAREFNEPLELGDRRVVAIDMSSMVGQKAVVARYVGPTFEVSLDFEMVRPGENEVTAAKRLLPRLVKEFDDDFDTVVGDGLYTQWFIQLGKDHQKDVVVKTREQAKDLSLVRLGEEWIQTHQRHGLEVAKPGSGVDSDGYKSYRYVDTGLHQAQGVSVPIRMIKIWEQRLKGDQEKDEHWLMTSLKAPQAAVDLVRLIARRRWGIENGAFRTTSQNHKAKRQGTQEGKAPEVRVGILLLAETIVRVYTWWKERQWNSPRSRRSSWQSIQKLLMRSVPALRQVRGVKPIGRPHWGLQDLRQPELRPTGTDTR